MTLETKLIPPGQANRPDARKVDYITIHETGNTNKGADADTHAVYLDSTVDKISWHYTVDDKKAVQHIPDGETAWHSGTTAGNRTSIGIEICVNSDGDFEAALKNAAELVRSLLATHGLTIDRVVQHNHWNGKNCPQTIRESGRWNEFLSMVQDKKGKRYEAVNGIHFRYTPVEDFRVLYWDKPKKTTAVSDYANGGFFGTYAENGENFTLPVANLAADIDESQVYVPALKYLREWGRIESGKLRCDCRRNASDQFKSKAPSTLVIDAQGRAGVQSLGALPDGTRYAVSGASVILGGQDASWSKDALPQGWLPDITRAAWHTLLGLADGYIVTIGIQTTTPNCISSSEAYSKLKGYGFTDVILLDGGGSFVFDHAGENVAATTENRRVNTLVL